MLDEMDRFPDWQVDEGIVDALLSVGGMVICGADEEGIYGATTIIRGASKPRRFKTS